MSYLGRPYKFSKKSVAVSQRKGKEYYFGLNNMDWNHFRLCSIAVIFCIIWGGLWFRAGYIQLWKGASLAERARRQHVFWETVSVPRGTITDRNGKVLAKSVECYSVYANPANIENISKVAEQLAMYLGDTQEKYINLLNKPSHFIWITRHIDDATAMALGNAKIPGVMLIKEYERVYPYKQIAGQLLGFVGVDGMGLEGVERSFNVYLSSAVTKQLVQKDAAGRRFYLENVKPEEIKSNDLQLTIDTQIQSIAEDNIARMIEDVGGKWGGVIVADVKTGEVLAWAQYPFFNPNAYRQYKPIDYRNRLALDAFEPGSTFKLFLVATALQEGLVTKDSVFNCENGIWQLKSAVIRDAGIPQNKLTVSEILTYSSNIGCGKISLELGAQKFHQYLLKLGFGQPVGLALAESKGILRRPQDWSETDLVSTSFGQSLSTTTIQLAQGFLAIANKGIYKPIKITTNNELLQEEVGEHVVFSEEVSKELLGMMRNVVDIGTGKKAKISGVSIAGKTGTSQKANNTGKYGEERIASFVGVFPVEDPQYLVLVVIDEPVTKKYGGIVAAPVFRGIANRIITSYGLLSDSEKLATNTEKKLLHKRETAILNLNKDLQALDRDLKPINEIRNKVVSKYSHEQHIDIKIPNVTGKSIRKAMELFAKKGLVPEVKGQGIVVIKQEPEAGTAIINQEEQQKYILWLSEK